MIPIWVYLLPVALLIGYGLVRFVMWNDKRDYPLGHFAPEDAADNERAWNKTR